mmetsp:Transcript_63922/g.208474  ORF Transcript_63922/g.208474 Transcript_63922/m.208474 type:complete len:264 (+) Transcript_63922:629-1420(+)
MPVGGFRPDAAWSPVAAGGGDLSKAAGGGVEAAEAAATAAEAAAALRAAGSALAKRPAAASATPGKPGVDRIVGPSAAGAKWVLVDAMQELIEAGRILRRPTQLGGSTSSDAVQEVEQVMTQAQAVLRHFWASRWSEQSLRERLASEMRAFLAVLERRQQASRGSPGLSGTTSQSVVAWQAARSLVAPLRKALDLHEKLCPQSPSSVVEAPSADAPRRSLLGGASFVVRVGGPSSAGETTHRQGSLPSVGFAERTRIDLADGG